MANFKKKLSSVLAVLFTALTCISSVPVKAAETTPKVVFVGIEHSPLVVGDTESFHVSSVGAQKVQYRIFQNKIGTSVWQELTAGYTTATNANEIKTINGLAKYTAGKYKLSIWVKAADTQGKLSNKNGSYDSYYVAALNCVSRDNNNRVYSNGDMDVAKDSYVVGETVKVNGIKGISGMKAPYTYKLHIYDVNSNVWSADQVVYRAKENLTWTPTKAGTYVLDVWAMSTDSTLWAKSTKLRGRIYESWKLKVITVTEKPVVEVPVRKDVTISVDGTVYGSTDAQNLMEINGDVFITGKDVVLNNAHVKGNVTVTGNNATLNNVKIDGALIVNPGVDGTINLNNVTYGSIQVLSGTVVTDKVPPVIDGGSGGGGGGGRTIDKTEVDHVINAMLTFARDQDILKDYVKIGKYTGTATTRSLSINIKNDANDIALKDLFNSKNDILDPTQDDINDIKGFAASILNLDLKVNGETLASYLKTKLSTTEYKDYTNAEFIALFKDTNYAGVISLINSMTTYNEPVEVVLYGVVIDSITRNNLPIYSDKIVTRDNIKTAFGVDDIEALDDLTLNDLTGTYVIKGVTGEKFTITIVK